MIRPDTSNLQPYQLRVLEELDQLRDRLERLAGYIGTGAFKALDKADQVLLREQFSIMDSLERVLGKRVERFATNPDEPVLVFWEQQPSDSDPLAQHAYRRAVPMSKVAGTTIPACDIQQELVICTRQVALDVYAARFE